MKIMTSSKNTFIMKIIILITILAILPSYCQSCDEQSQQFLVTFHPHLDAFWLNFDNQLKDISFRPEGFLYNMNQRNSKTIFNSMLDALNSSSQRKYFVTEVVFLKDWLDYISPEKKELVKKLMANGQLEVTNGGWVQNDEAVCYYDDILDQYALGHNFLYEQMDYQVKIAWATDSFGHSHSQVALEHLLGIQFQGLQRVDDRYVNNRKNNPLLQFYWNPVSDSNNLTYGGVLNHVRHFLHEVNNYRGANPTFMKQDYEQIKKRMKTLYKKNKFFRFLGNDFQQFLPEEFVNLEATFKLLNSAGNSQTCPVFKYGNPTDYLDLITKYYSKNQLPERKYDFIPNFDQERYWAGYFTTDPLLKKACKDFSRLVNFYRKSLLFLNAYSQNNKTLINAQQLLAVLQHHDGITATSKTYIENEFRRRIQTISDEIMKSLTNIHQAKNTVTCKFHQNSNQCQIPMEGESMFKSLHIITHGSSKKQKIQLILPDGVFYDVAQVEEDIFCEKLGRCVLVLQALLHPGINKYTLIRKSKQELTSSIFELSPAENMVHKGQNYQIGVNNTNIKYSFGDQFYDLGLYTSPNHAQSRQVTSWDKFGKRSDRTENVNPGMYIMLNNGKLQPITSPFNQLSYAEGRLYNRFVTSSEVSKIKITVKRNETNVLDTTHTFKPKSLSMMDYFIKVSSNIKSNTLYHDANGFLVAKRELNQRSDYQFVMKEQDKINGNTYPVCSFAYLLNNNKKFLFFTDRAQGVASFQGDLLINFDRLAMDDYKGVGQSYSKTMNNTWRYKFAQVDAQNDIERIWQKQYDEGLIGFLSQNQNDGLKYSISNEKQNQPRGSGVSNLKYTIFYLNTHQFVLRLQNLAQFSSLSVTKYSGTEGIYTWVIQQLGLNLVFADIKQSYANGIVKETGHSWRKYWAKQNSEQISMRNQGKQDGQKINFRPLEIRSFRVNLNQKIVARHVSRIQDSNSLLQPLKNVVRLRSTRKRCF